MMWFTQYISIISVVVDLMRVKKIYSIFLKKADYNKDLYTCVLTGPKD